MKILKFGAVWCMECLVMKPRLEKIEEEFPGLETEYYDVDSDEAKDVVKKYDIKNPPTFVFLDKDGNEFERMEGEIDRRELVEFMKNNINK